jgi:tape measure domain-containing protein
MATSNTRDVKMTLSVETLGADEIKKLQDSVARLAREGGDAAPEFQRLADEIGRLGEQANALRTFEELSATMGELAGKQQQATQRVDELRVALDLAREATTRDAEAQRAAAAEVDNAKKVKQDLAAALRKLNTEYDLAGKKTREYKAALNDLIDKQATNAKSLVDLVSARRNANAALAESAGAEQRLEAQYNKSAKSLAQVSTALADQQRALDLQSAAAAQLGVSTENMATAQAELIKALNETGASATRAAGALDGVGFQRQIDEAKRLRESAEYVQFWEQALRDADLAAKEMADQQAFQRQIDEAQRLREAADYVQFWEQALREADLAAKELADQKAFTQQLAEAERLRTAAEYVQFWEQALREANLASEAAAESAKRLGNAFDTVGARSASGLRAEIDQVRAAMQTLGTQAGLTGGELASAMAAGNARIAELERQLREATGQLTLADKAAKLFSNSMGQIAAGNLIADGIGYLVEKVKEMGREFVAVNVQADSMRRALNAVYKDTEITAQQIDFLRKTATTAGVSISGITDDFVKFAAATRSSNIDLKTTDEVFRSVTLAASSLGLGAEKTSLALNALGQIASKGVVSMEELRQQLGDAVPGALSLTAKGLGITDAELVKLVESGKLAARDFFPAFAKGLSTLQGETDGLRQTWERFKNVLTITATNAGDAGWVQILTLGLKGLGVVVSVVTLGFSQMYEGVMTITRGVIVFYETLAGRGAQALEFFNEEVAKTNSRLEEQRLAIAYMLNPTEELRAKLTTAGLANRDFSSSALATSDALKLNTTALQESAQAALGVQAGQSAAAKALQITGDASREAGSKWVQLNVEMLKLRDTQEQAVAVSEKARTAAEHEAEAVSRLGALRGDSVAKLESEARAATINESALAAVAKAREAEAAVITVQLNEMVKLALAQDGSLEKRRQEIESIKKKADTSQEEAAAARSAAEGARIERQQRELLVQTYRDNSGAVEQLRRAMELANEAANLTVANQRLGIATTQEVAAANEEAARTTVLYRDALSDTTAKLQANNDSKQADYQITLAGLNVRAAQIRSLEATAKAVGDENLLTYAKIEAKNIEIAILKATTAMQTAEAEGTIAVSKAKLEELKATEPLNAVKRIELETSIKVAEAKVMEAKARGQGVDILLREIQALREGTAAKESNAASSNNASGMIARESQSRSTNADAIQRENDALERQEKLADGVRRSGGGFVNKEGWSSDAKGNAVSAAMPTWMSLYNFTKQMGVSDAQAREISDKGFDEFGNYKQQLQANNMRSNIDGIDMYEAARREVEKIMRNAPPESAKTTTNTPQNTTTQQPQTNAPRPVTINLNGTSRTVNVSSQSDVNALEGLLRELTNSQTRAT